MANSWTKAEIEEEMQRRDRAISEARIEALKQKPVPDADANCIHCGRPFRLALASAGKYGLCDDCHFAD